MQAFSFYTTASDEREFDYFSSTASVKPSKLRATLAHTAGSILLAVAMVAQPTSAAMTLPSSAAGRVAEALPSTSSAAPSRYFSVTGKTTRGDFLKTFDKFGLERIGYPLSDERQENGRTVQYFERVRMEYHPETASKGYSVLMTRLGVDLTQGQQFDQVKAFQSTATRVYLPQTGHSLAEPFLSHWKANGGLELFGYPISEPFAQGSLTVQWFERARFEYHPELQKTGKPIQLSLLGQLAYEKSAAAQSNAAPAKPAAPAPAQPELSANESWLLQAINQQRAAAGLQPVQISGPVTDIARARSGDMAQRNYFSHTTPEGKNFLAMMTDKGIRYKYAGEILARNNYSDAEATKIALDSYLGSAPHKAIMLDGRFNQVGVGYTKSDEDGMHYFAVIFVQQ